MPVLRIYLTQHKVTPEEAHLKALLIRRFGVRYVAASPAGSWWWN